MECDFRNTIACSPQSWDWLKNKGSINDEVSRRVWKSVKTKVGKISMGKTKRKRKKRRERKKTRREETEVERIKEERTKERKINRSKKDGRRMENLGWGRENSKIREKGKKTGSTKISQVDSCLWSKKPVKECPQENYRIMQLIQRKNFIMTLG